MKKFFRISHLFLLSVLIVSCVTTPVKEILGDSQVEVTLFQLNDIYEIGTLEHGKYGGMARAATVLRELEKENPNTYALVAGDFLSPSVIGTVKLDGKRVSGAQMVDVMNAVGIDYVTFGNHEFDVKENELQERINESSFTWISSNVKHIMNGIAKPFEKISGEKSEQFPESVVIESQNIAGAKIRIGLFGLTLPANRVGFIQYENVYDAARRVFNQLKDKCDAVIALTHLSIDEDKELAKQIPELKLIIGGHEHNNMHFNVGNTSITKADANARTAYVHHLVYDTEKKSLSISSKLKTIDASMKEEPEIAATVNKWTKQAMDGFRSQGFDPDAVVATGSEPLDGLENSIRNHGTNLGTLITQSMLNAAPKCQAAITKSGSVRIDDQVSGKITQYDIIRILPFGGKILQVEMKGSLLQQILDAGLKNKGSGGFLQTANITHDETGGIWSIQNKPIGQNQTYMIAITDFLLTGLESNLSFLTKENKDIMRIIEPDASNTNDLCRDVRLALISWMKKMYR